MSTFRSVFTSIATAVMAGGYIFMGVAISIGVERQQVGGLVVLGAIWGAIVLGLMRLFPVARWALPIAGMLVGPAVLLAMLAKQPIEDPGGAWVLGAFFGLVLGLLEWARLSRSEARRGRAER